MRCLGLGGIWEEMCDVEWRVGRDGLLVLFGGFVSIELTNHFGRSDQSIGFVDASVVAHPF